MTRAVLALGSNLGDRAARLRAAVRALDDVLITVSPVYETPPWPPPDSAGSPPSPWYLNAVVLVADGGDDPWAWLARARELESAAGRIRDPDHRYAPRTLDVDVIAVCAADGEPVTSDDPELTLPHPRAHLRAFVLRPWLDVQPYAVLPGHGRVLDLIRADPVARDLADVRAVDGLTLESA